MRLLLPMIFGAVVGLACKTVMICFGIENDLFWFVWFALYSYGFLTCFILDIYDELEKRKEMK